MQNPPPPNNNNAVPPAHPHQIPYVDDELEGDAGSEDSSTSSDLSDGRPYPAVDGTDDTSDEEDDANESSGVPPRLPVLQSLRAQYDPQRMILTEEERQWAIALKEHIDMIPDIDNPTDYWLAQTALVCRGDIVKGVWRLGRLMEFRADKYNISDEETYEWTPEQALAFIEHGFLRAFPGIVIFFHFCPEEETYIVGVDVGKFDTGQVRISEQKTQEFMKGWYFFLQALSPDLETVRNGTLTMAEWEGVGWSYNVDIQFARRIASDLGRPFPMKRKKIKNYHTGPATTTFIRMCQAIFPPQIANKFEVGCQMDGRMDELFMVPTREAATDRLLRNLKEALRYRHQNEENFTLNHPLSWQVQNNAN